MNSKTDWKGMADRLGYVLIAAILGFFAHSQLSDGGYDWDRLPPTVAAAALTVLGVGAINSKLGDKSAGFGGSKQQMSSKDGGQ